MNTLNQIIGAYTDLMQQAKLQIVYRGIMDFIGRLRSDFIRIYPHYAVSGIYRGYLDMSYFSFASKGLQKNGL